MKRAMIRKLSRERIKVTFARRKPQALISYKMP